MKTERHTVEARRAVRDAYEAINLHSLKNHRVGELKKLAYELAARLGELQSAIAADAMDSATTTEDSR